MTIVIGMFGADGSLVMGADSEETGETLKARVMKLPICRDEGKCLIIGGAGPACHVDTLTQLLSEAFISKPDFKDELELESRFRLLIDDYYKRNVLCWPTAMERSENDFQLLIGGSFKAEHEHEGSPKNYHMLWMTEQNTFRRVQRHAAIGLGKTYANALMEDHKGCYSSVQTALAAIHILQKVKRDVSNCGKETAIWRFDDYPYFMSQSDVQEAEELFRQYEKLAHRQFFSVVSYIKTKAEVETDANTAAELRKLKLAFRKLARKIENTNVLF
jgi:hypothetical protein